LDEWSARRKASTYTGQHNTERQGTNIHALSGIRTHDPSKTHASDRTATVTDVLVVSVWEFCYKFWNKKDIANSKCHDLEAHAQLFRFHLTASVLLWICVFGVSEYSSYSKHILGEVEGGSNTVNQTFTVYVCHSVIRRLEFMGISNWKVGGKT
jgi:hypothetical protein